jgi:excisionase family DNA binding protein
MVFGVKMLTTAQVAAKLKITRPRVNQLIAEKRLPATLFGRIYLIDPADLSKVRDRKPGRPRKSK